MKCESFKNGGRLGRVLFETLTECKKLKYGWSGYEVMKQDVLSLISSITYASFWTLRNCNKKTWKCESLSYSVCSTLVPIKKTMERKAVQCLIKLRAFKKPLLTWRCELENVRKTWYCDLDSGRCTIGSGDKWIYDVVMFSLQSKQRSILSFRVGPLTQRHTSLQIAHAHVW